MAIKINVPGAVLVKMDFGANSGYTGLQNVGYTVDGCEVIINEYSSEIKSDRYGGEQGPAIDKQIFGLDAEIRLNFSEIDPKMFTLLESRMPGVSAVSSNPGRITSPGTLGFGGGNLIRVLLYGDLDVIAVAASVPMADLLTPKNFPFCSVHQATSKNLGARAARANVTMKAYQGVVSGNVVLWNQVIV